MATYSRQLIEHMLQNNSLLAQLKQQIRETTPRAEGVIKATEKGFGFLERDDKEKDCFVHITALKAAGLRTLQEGEKLEFTLEDGPKGPSAVNLKKID